MITMASLATMLLLQTVPSLAVAEPTVSTVTIVAVGERPPFASGYIKTSVLVLGRSDEGTVRVYYMISYGPEQPLPPLGRRCSIRHSPGRLEMVGGLEIVPFLIGEEFDAFECGPAPSHDELIQSEWRRQPD